MDITNLHHVIFTVGRMTPTGVQLLGTCFLLNKDSLFATASHVTNNDNTNLVVVTSQTSSLTNYQDTSNTQVRIFQAEIYKVDPIRDICILKIDAAIQSNLKIGGTNDIQVSETVGIIGYPHCDMSRHILTFQKTEVGAKILIETSDIKSNHIVLNIQTRPGQSGSPIFRMNDSLLIGIVLGSYVPQMGGGISLGGIDPQTLHQTTHAISSEYITKMI